MLLVSNSSERGIWEKQLADMEQEDSGSFFTEHAAELRYHVIQRFDGEREANLYLEQHLNFAIFREMAIKHQILNVLLLIRRLD
ncbi:hypothetical protein FHT67_002512 [Paenibacillus sp. BK720]|nr:hypothetical protein [Paenibacillus sp. BK720]